MKQNLFSKLWLRVGMIVAIMTTALSGTAWAATTYEQLTSIANIDESAQYVLGIDGTGFHYEGTSSWGKTALPSAQAPIYYTLTKASDGNSFTAKATISGTTYYLQIPTSNTFSMATSTGTNTDIIIGTTQVSGTNYAVANKTTTARHLRINGTSGLRSYAGTTGSMAFFYKVVEEVSAYTITAQSNNTDYGTVSLTGTTITATPASGYRVSTTSPYVVNSGTATVTQNGNTFEVTASSNCTITINFEAIPTVSGYIIDFESDVDCYEDWTITNIGTSNTAITAHGGSQYGANINDSGNGVSTASIQTNETIALPGSFTCYVSKVSTNTTSSTWKVQVSSDGSTWTDVSSQDATSMSKGSWVEFTANLSAYSNVYVRIYYSGSNAIRAIDDISITMRDPNAKITPTVTIDDTGITTTDIAGNTNVAAGTLAATVTSGETTITTPAVTWSSSDTGVATVNATTGAVTLIATGTTTITATFAGNDDYTEAEATYELTVVDTYAKGQANNPYTVAEAITAIQALPNNNATSEKYYVRGVVSAFYGDATGIMSASSKRYYISDDGTTTTQLLVYSGKGLNDVAFSSDDDLLIGDEVVIYGAIQNYQGNTPEMASGNYIVSLNRPVVQYTLAVTASANVEIFTYVGNNEAVEGTTTQQVNNGTVVGLSVSADEGYVLTLEVDGEDVTSELDETGYYTFTMPSHNVEITATAVEYVAPVTADYVLATSITSGKRYVIASGTEGTVNVMAEQRTNNRGAVEATIIDGVLSVSDEYEFLIESTDDGYTIYDEDVPGYLYAASSSSNYLKTQGTNDANGVWAITFDAETGAASIVAQGTNTRNVIRFNSSNNPPIFSCYASGQQDIYLFEKVEATPEDVSVDITIGYGTLYYSDRNLVVPTGVEAYTYKVTNKLEVSKTYEAGNVIPAGTAVVLKAANGSYTFEATTETGEGDEDNNALKGSDEAATTTGGTYYYALSLNSSSDLSSVGFYWMTTGGAAFTCGAHKAYLALDNTFAELASGGVKGFIALPDDDATAISTVESFTEEGAIYNVAGQRLQKMQKGINIVNGKKVLK